ncbi:unnamed protein product [Miscanthus lutarioriparius]|uniref:Uncharacterized protein n=1 Tax=Miscanthus lutarioriparius TaxID=422564 RepID=A0A811R7G4_9POAL|nr:unnamed protein product [Miscanthus lutarioriparius]
MAPSSSLSSPLHLPRYTPSSLSTCRLGPGTVYQHSPYSTGRMQPSKGLKSVAVASSYHQDEAAGHGDNNSIAATGLLHHVDNEVAPPELRAGGGALWSSPKGRPASPPREDDGSDKINGAAAPTFATRARGPTPPGLPAEGSGGNGGSKH